jgi:hypothetical protein
MTKNTTDKKWLLHLEASRSALVSVVGFNSYEDYKVDICRMNNYSKRAAECLRNFIPYCIQKLDKDSGKVIVLNREYKPIGYCGSYDNWVNYGDFDSAIADIESPEMQALLKACGKDKAGRDWIWFTCNDLTVPWASPKGVRRLIGIIDAALNATAQENNK